MMLTRRELLASAAGGLCSCALAACAHVLPRERSATVFCFDTVCQLRGATAQSVIDGAAELCNRYEQLFSRTIETSDVARINAAGGAAVEVAPETAELIAAALDYCAQSEGLFDITIGAVSELWDFHEGVVPDDEAIQAALEDYYNKKSS